VPCTNYLKLKGHRGGVEVPLYSVILGGGVEFAHHVLYTASNYVCHQCGSLISHRVMDFAGQPSFVRTF